MLFKLIDWKWCVLIESKKMNFCDIIPIASVGEDAIVLNDGSFVTVLEILPINFKLKSVSEQSGILESYRLLLKSCDFNIQIFVQTQKASIESHVKEIKNCISYEPEISEMAGDYLNHIKEITEVRGSISRSFFIAFKSTLSNKEERIRKISEGLLLCGNMAKVCYKEQLLEILKFCFKNFISNSALGSY